MDNNHSLGPRKISIGSALLSNLLLVLGFYFIFNGFASVVIKLLYGGIPTEEALLTGGPLVKNAILIGQLSGILVGMVILPFLYIIFLKKELQTAVFELSWKNAGVFFLAAFMITFTVLPFIGVVGDWNKAISFPESWKGLEDSLSFMEDKAITMTNLIVYCETTPELLLVIFTIAFLPAVAEELVFRGVLMNELIRSTGNVHLSVFISGLVFSFIHFQFFGFFPRLLLGIVLGYLYLTSGNILVPMVMHFTNNAMVVIALNLNAKGVLSLNMESSESLPIETIVLSFVLSIALLYYCWRLYQKRKVETRHG